MTISDSTVEAGASASEKHGHSTLERPRIGIVKLGAIGDVVNSLPFVNRLRDAWPEAHITWCIAPLAHKLVVGHAAVDDFLILELRRPSQWFRHMLELRRARFDLVIDLQRIAKSGLVARISGAKRRLGFDRARSKESSWVFMTERIPPNDAPGVTVEQYLEFADHLGLPPSPTRWDLPQSTYARSDQQEPLIVINPGASKEANRWPAVYWAELCRELVEEFGASIVVTGGAEDRALASELQQQSGVALVDSCGQYSLKESAGLFAAADLFVGGDTGPLHMAVAVGTPVVALFGAADPARTGPHGQSSRVVSHWVPCSPCRKRICLIEGHPCMRDLEVERVLEKIRETLVGRPRSGRSNVDLRAF
ncbi:MAG: heptosyltransferase-1 [Planctomycetota bacterium]|jgi:heptosyltransferase-1